MLMNIGQIFHILLIDSYGTSDVNQAKQDSNESEVLSSSPYAIHAIHTGKPNPDPVTSLHRIFPPHEIILCQHVTGDQLDQIMGQALAGGNPLDSTPYKDKCLRVVFRSNSKLHQF